MSGSKQIKTDKSPVGHCCYRSIWGVLYPNVVQ